MIKAAYYSRVSTKMEEQKQSLDAQIADAEQLIENMEPEGWQFVGGYIDRKSGTTTRMRTGYTRLIADMKAGKIDVLVIKSLDRGWRNTLDWKMFEKMLIDYDVRLYNMSTNQFYNAKTTQDRMMSGFENMTSEAFSALQSEKLKGVAARKRRMGIPSSNGLNYGYNWVDKKFVINESEAVMIRLLFNMYIQGTGVRKISLTLESMGYKNRAGTGPIAEQTLRNIIRNEKYKGVLIIGKNENDFWSKRKTNRPQEDWVVIPGGIPAIVDEETWEKANAIYRSRAFTFSGKGAGEWEKTGAPGKYPLSGKIWCSECMTKYTHAIVGRQTNRTAGWRCDNYRLRGRTAGGCTGLGYVTDAEVYSAAKKVVAKITTITDEEIKTAFAAIKKTLTNAHDQNRAGDIKKQIDKKELELKTISKNLLMATDSTSLERYREIEQEQVKEITALKKELTKLTVSTDKLEENAKRLKEMREKVELLRNGSAEIPSEALDEYIDKVEINGKRELKIYVKGWKPVVKHIAERKRKKKVSKD